MIREKSPVFTGISLGSRYWASCNLDARGSTQYSPISLQGSSSPSVLLPRYAGEPLRFDTWYPTHPRGTGRTGPSESSVSPEFGTGRFPLAAVWSGRKIRDAKWAWSPEYGEPGIATTVDAVAIACRALVARYGGAKTAVVIPNDFHQYEQQRVLDEINAVHPDTQLLWRPIAAALAWLDEIKEAEWTSLYGRSLGDLVVVHCDWGHIQSSRLELHYLARDSTVPIVPARRRPVVADRSICGFGWGLIESERDLIRDWSLIFASDVSRSIESLISPEVVDQLFDSKSTWLAHLTKWMLPQQSISQSVDELVKHLKASSRELFGILVVGDFAWAITAWLQQICAPGQLQIQRPIATYSGLESERLLAKGAAIHLLRRAAGEVSYYDSLPQIELFIDRRGEYEWLGLLEASGGFVQGGVPWERKEPITGFELRKGASQVKFVLAHEEYDGVREVVSSFDDSYEQRTPVILHVSCTPAQGNAKLRLVTQPTARHNIKEVHANWQRMLVKKDAHNRPMSKADYMKGQPRAFPELMPRLASLNKWRIARRSLEQLLDRLDHQSTSRVLQDRAFLDNLKSRLMQKDAAQMPQDATAIGSDFRCPVHAQQRFLERASEALLRLWREHWRNAHSHVTIVIRALGYLSVDNVEFERWLVESDLPAYADSQAVEHTCGLVLRNPKNIADFINKIFISPDFSPGPNPLKAVSQVLRYRTEATADLTSAKAADIIKSCLIHFEQGIMRGGNNFAFRWSSLIIVYLLRRRMFDPDFLDPSCSLANRAKAMFSEAIRKCKTGKLRPLRGTVDLPAALEQMIAYIDRRGSGDILMAAEDS